MDMKEKQERFGLSGIRRQQLNKSDSGDCSSTSTSTTTMMMMMKKNKTCDSNACVRYIERTEASETGRQAGSQTFDGLEEMFECNRM